MVTAVTAVTVVTVITAISAVTAVMIQSAVMARLLKVWVLSVPLQAQ